MDLKSGDIVVVNYGNEWIIGKLSGKKYDAWYMTEPRRYIQSTTRHGVIVLPGEPAEIAVGNYKFIYKLPDGEVKSLYIKQTSVVEVVPSIYRDN